jgi:hypothetical protein
MAQITGYAKKNGITGRPRFIDVELLLVPPAYSDVS